MLLTLKTDGEMYEEEEEKEIEGNVEEEREEDKEWKVIVRSKILIFFNKALIS